MGQHYLTKLQRKNAKEQRNIKRKVDWEKTWQTVEDKTHARKLKMGRYRQSQKLDLSITWNRCNKYIPSMQPTQGPRKMYH